MRRNVMQSGNEGTCTLRVDSEAWDDDAVTTIRMGEVVPREQRPDLPLPASAPLASTKPQAGQLRLLPLGFGMLLGVLLSSSALAALEKPVGGLRIPEVAVAHAPTAADGLRTAPFETSPSAEVPTQTGLQATPFETSPSAEVPTHAKPSRGLRKRMGARRAHASAANRTTRLRADDAFALLASKLRRCTAAQSGTTRLVMTVQPSGIISHAIVYGRFEGPEGSCMARAARGLHLPKEDGRARVVDRSFSW